MAVIGAMKNKEEDKMAVGGDNIIKESQIKKKINISGSL